MNDIKKQIASHFNAAAASYDQAADLQRIIGNQLMKHLIDLNHTPKNILDLGAGTGYFSRILAEQYTAADIVAVDIAEAMLLQAGKIYNKNTYFICSDFDCLPFANAHFDVIYANLCLQWSLDFKKTLLELRRILKPDGIILFSTFGKHSLRELRSSWQRVDRAGHVNNFISIKELKSNLQSYSFDTGYLKIMKLKLYFSNVLQVLRNFKLMGANYVIGRSSMGLTGKSCFKNFMQYYERYRNLQGELPVTYEVIYGLVTKEKTPERL